LSKVAIKGASTGTATFTIESPATNTNRTLTLPDAAGTVVTDSATQTLTNKTINASQLVDASITAAKLDGAQSGSAPIYAARAWVNFDGTTATPSTIRGSGNVSSITKSNTGRYIVNFTTAMPSTNYAQHISVASTTNNNINGVLGISASNSDLQTTSTTAVTRDSASNAFLDMGIVCVSIFV
jgi:hypothetical protein